MKKTRILLLLGVAAVAAAGIALAMVPGGGSPKNDCYAEFDGVTATKIKPKPIAECTDGTACDGDGSCNNSCDFSLRVCINQADATLPLCTPPGTLASITQKGATDAILPTVLTGSGCGAFTTQTVPLKQKHNGSFKKARKIIRVTAKAPKGTKHAVDQDQITLTCLPNPNCSTTTTTFGTTTTSTTIVGGPTCPTNAAGGPDELDLIVTAGSDLDNGTSGQSHNFPVPVGTTIKLCLQDCNTTTNSTCHGTGSTDAGPTTPSLNGLTFGPPLPLISANTPVCVVNKYRTNPNPPQGIPPNPNGDVIGTVDIATGIIEGTINLNSEVWTTKSAKICPKCSGADIGQPGTCDSGAKKSKPCTTEGVVFVNSPANPVINNVKYTLSHECPPGDIADQKVATLAIDLAPTNNPNAAVPPTKTGAKPCPGQSADDACNGATCTASCPGTAPPQGGISETCCNNAQHTPCFPTKGGGTIDRTPQEQAEAPTPPWASDQTYPKTAAGGAGEVLASVFCIGDSGGTIDTVAGLPGPGALLLPVSQCYKMNGQTCP